MPKMKSRRAAMKRFKRTASGKVMRRQAYASHILTKKSTKRKRQLREGLEVAQVDVKRVKKMMVGG